MSPLWCPKLGVQLLSYNGIHRIEFISIKQSSMYIVHVECIKQLYHTKWNCSSVNSFILFILFQLWKYNPLINHKLHIHINSYHRARFSLLKVSRARNNPILDGEKYAHLSGLEPRPSIASLRTQPPSHAGAGQKLLIPLGDYIIRNCIILWYSAALWLTRRSVLLELERLVDYSITLCLRQMF